ncbi:phosphoadenylylsulfate reductase [Flammeovirgaceae bacterium 311]|nr:phosphoadenylylsulfate reductase [Flammeovirgaceae bacterium 311]
MAVEIKHIKDKIENYKAEGKKLFTTSSFQTHSLVLLHILSQIDNTIPVYLINTGYHFPETIAFAEQVCRQFKLPLVDLKSETPKSMQRDTEGRLLFTSDPDYCCYLNKTQPLDIVLRTHDVWINGIRADQSKTRSAMLVEQSAPHGSLRYHPMLNWSKQEIWRYIKAHNLPRHALDAKGYVSIGCEPCTRRPDPGMQEREARWYGLKKTECGLHTDLVSR